MALELAVVSLCMRQAQNTQLCSINWYNITSDAPSPAPASDVSVTYAVLAF